MATKRDSAPSTAAPVANTLISADQVVSTKRGRKAVINADLRDALASVPVGSFMRMDTLGPVPKAKQGDVGQNLRKHWKAAHGDEAKCSVKWTPDGLAQVGHRS